MKNYFKTHPYAKAGLLAIPIILLMVAMENFFPDFSPDGFPNFIVAFEFANTLQDLNLLLSSLSPMEMEKIDKGNYIDFGFMITYCLFLFLFFRKAYKIHGSRFLLAGIPLSIVILAADFYENIFLLKITDIYTKNGIITELQQVLNQLQIVTWIKWEGLALAFFLLFFIFIRGKNLSKIAAVFCLLPLIQGILFWVSPVFTITGFTLSVFGAFSVLFVYSFAFSQK
ncbi:MAG: hypothetical protein ACQETJ_12325 [Bacteroidota bacterium]